MHACRPTFKDLTPDVYIYDIIALKLDETMAETFEPDAIEDSMIRILHSVSVGGFILTNPYPPRPESAPCRLTRGTTATTAADAAITTGALANHRANRRPSRAAGNGAPPAGGDAAPRDGGRAPGSIQSTTGREHRRCEERGRAPLI